MQHRTTRGHFACACVNPQNDNSVGASNLMAGNRKLARKVTVLLKAISLVLWILYFPTKIFSMKKIRRILRGFSLVDFSAEGFLGLLKTFMTQRQKVMFSLAKQCISMVWFPNSWFCISGRKCIVAMFSCFKTKSEKKIYHARFIY